MANLYLMCGVPASGKSTFLKERVKNNPNSVIVSRDEIRFTLLKEGESYFSHESEVLDYLWTTVNNLLRKGKNVFVDQTSLTKKSRTYALKQIKIKCDTINAIYVYTSYNTCIERNEKRKGTKTYVPPEQLKGMYKKFSPPSIEEGFDCIYGYQSETNKIYKKGKN